MVVASEETVGAGVKIAQHESAAHQKRNWVRLTFDCNDRCIFCLDSDTHDGTMRDREEVKAQILDGRRKGAERLILSGGEPTIHPNFVDFVRLGRRAGYDRVQTVTNGRMFAYPGFLKRAIDAGLGEITFSIHGPDAKVHDALVGVKGAYAEEIKGLRNVLEDGRPIVNIDVCVNRANVKHLGAMLRKYIAMGVKEFDLLQVIPFGRAFIEGRDTLFYDLAEMRSHLLEAFEFSKRPDVHLWLNRFPIEHLEGYEHLIQDPYKLTDEVRGRKEEFARLIDYGIQLDCREPTRCGYCYVRRLCDHLEDTRAELSGGAFDVVRVDTRWESQQPAVYGGDPASARSAGRNGRSLPVVGQSDAPGPTRTIVQRATDARVATLWVCAPDPAAAKVELDRFPHVRALELELEDYAGLADAELPVTRAVATDAEQAQTLLAMDGEFEVVAELNRDTATWLLSLESVPERLALRMPTHDKLTASADGDVELSSFFERFTHPVPVEGVPACVTGRAPRPPRRVLDATMMMSDGRLEIFRYARRFIRDHYRVKSLRCRDCFHEPDCAGLHVNYVRAHGFDAMRPVIPSSA